MAFNIDVIVDVGDDLLPLRYCQMLWSESLALRILVASF